MKIGQAEKFLEARQDSKFAELMRIGDLSPRQIADQLNLRRSADEVEMKLDEVEAAVQSIQRSLGKDKGKGRSDGDDPGSRYVPCVL